MRAFVNRTKKMFTAGLVLAALCARVSTFAYSADNELYLDFNGHTMSAELYNASLEQILERTRKEKGIWYEANKAVLEEKISVQFKEVTLEQGIRRILSHINHVLVYDEEGNVMGVLVFGKEKIIMPPRSRKAILGPFERNPRIFDKRSENATFGKEDIFDAPPFGEPDTDPFGQEADPFTQPEADPFGQ